MSRSLDFATLEANCRRLGIPVPIIAKAFPGGDNQGGARPGDPTYGSNPFPQFISNGSYATYNAVATNGYHPTIALNSDILNTNRAYFANNVAITGDITVMAVVTPRRQTTGADVCAVGKWNTGGSAGTNEWMLELNYDTGPTDYRPSWAIEIGSTATTIHDTNTWAVGERLVIAGVRRGTSQELYRASRMVASGACGTGAINNVRTQIDLGSIVVGTAFNTQADYECVLIWNEALSAGQIADLGLDPIAVLFDDDYEPIDEDVVYAPVHVYTSSINAQTVTVSQTVNVLKEMNRSVTHAPNFTQVVDPHRIFQSISSSIVLDHEARLPGLTERIISGVLSKTGSGGRQVTRIGSTLYAVAYDGSHTYVLQSSDEGFSWVQEQIVAWSAFAGSIYQGASGQPVLALVRGNADGRIRTYQRDSTGSWNVGATIATGNTTDCLGFQILYDNTKYHMIYSCRTGSTNARTVYHRTSTALGSWSTATALDTGDTSGTSADVDRAISACLDKDGDIHVAYCQNKTNKFLLRYIKRTGTTWGSVELVEDLGADSAGIFGRVTQLSIVTDSNKVPHFFGSKYFVSTKQVVYYTRLGGTWSSPVRVNPTTADQTLSTAGFNAGTLPNVVYRSIDQDASIWYSEKRSSIWTTEDVSKDVGGDFPDQVYDPFRASARPLQGLFLTMKSSLDFVVTSDLVWGDSPSSADSALFSQTIHVQGVDHVSGTLTMSHEVARHYAYPETLTQAVSISATTVFSRTRPRSLTQGLTLAQAIGFSRTGSVQVYSPSIVQGISLESRVPLGSRARPLTVGQTITLSQLAGLTYFEAIVHSFDVSDDILLNATRNLTETNAVDMTGTVFMNKSLNLGVSHTIVMGSAPLVLRGWVWYEQAVNPGWAAVYETQIGDFIILGPDELPTISMTLPRPEWDDVDELERRKASIRRNRTGEARTFVVPVYENHRYRWGGLVRFKAYEFRNIIKTLLGKRVRIRDHNGVWKHVVITNERVASVQKGPEWVAVELDCTEVDRVA